MDGGKESFLFLPNILLHTWGVLNSLRSVIIEFLKQLALSKQPVGVTKKSFPMYPVQSLQENQVSMARYSHEPSPSINV